MNPLLHSTLRFSASPFLHLKFPRRGTFQPWEARLPWEGSGADNLRSYFFPPPSHSRTLFQCSCSDAGWSGRYRACYTACVVSQEPPHQAGPKRGQGGWQQREASGSNQGQSWPPGSRGMDACHCQPIPVRGAEGGLWHLCPHEVLPGLAGAEDMWSAHLPTPAGRLQAMPTAVRGNCPGLEDI